MKKATAQEQKVTTDGIDVDVEPLYQRVARWGWSLGRPFSRDDVAKVFGISRKQAGDVISYIRHARSDVVKSQLTYTQRAGRARQRLLQILSEPHVNAGPANEPPEPRTAPAQNEPLHNLRRWFISRFNHG